MTVVSEASLIRDVAQGLVRRSQDMRAMDDPLAPEIVAHGKSRESANDSGEVNGMNAEVARNRGARSFPSGRFA
jgi:hypothetical protein